MNQLRKYEWKHATERLADMTLPSIDNVYWLPYLQQWSAVELHRSSGRLTVPSARQYPRERQWIEEFNRRLIDTNEYDQVRFKIEVCASLAFMSQLKWTRIKLQRRVQWQTAWRPIVEPSDRAHRIVKLHTPVSIREYQPYVPSIPETLLDWTLLFTLLGQTQSLNPELLFLIHVYADHYTGGFLCLRDFLEHDITELRNLTELVQPYQTRLHRLTLLKKYKVTTSRLRRRGRHEPAATAVETQNERWQRLFPKYKSLESTATGILTQIQQAEQTCTTIWMQVEDHIWYDIPIAAANQAQVLQWKRKEQRMYLQIRKWQRWWYTSLYRIRPLHRRRFIPEHL